MAYVRGLRHGLAAGVVVGLLVAPRSGPETRRILGAAYAQARSRADQTSAGIRRGWQRAQPAILMARQAGGLAGRVASPAARGAVAQVLGRRANAEPEPFFSSSAPTHEDGV